MEQKETIHISDGAEEVVFSPISGKDNTNKAR
jgi:hypothetical protein